MGYKRKTVDEYRLYVNYGYGHGWEHECSYDSLRELKQGLKEYRANMPYPVKGKKVRVKKVTNDNNT